MLASHLHKPFLLNLSSFKYSLEEHLEKITINSLDQLLFKLLYTKLNLNGLESHYLKLAWHKEEENKWMRRETLKLPHCKEEKKTMESSLGRTPAKKEERKKNNEPYTSISSLYMSCLIIATCPILVGQS